MTSLVLNNKIEHLAKYEKLLDSSLGRKTLTEKDPLAFALIYLSHHLKGDETKNAVTFSEFHEYLVEYALTWMEPLGKMREYRDVFIAPRAAAKTTWLYLLIPMWAAAHEHTSFIAAFSDSTSQAQNHLATFKRELDTNKLLQADYPELTTPAKRTVVARTLADNRGQIIQANNFVFMAQGIDNAVAGLKVGATRPTVILLDDCEPGESNYSVYQAKKRLSTIQDVILPLNAFARVAMVGTTTMAGSLMHNCVEYAHGQKDESHKWIDDESFDVHYFPAIITDDVTGEERSIWPEKWPLEELQEMRNTRSFAKNFMNLPMDSDSQYFKLEDIVISNIDDYGTTILSIDPAVTSKTTSDFTGLAVVSKHPSEAKLYVRYATHVKVGPQELRSKAIELINRYPEIVGILIETNQGADLWDSVFGGMGVKVKKIHQKASKEVRVSKALVHYERGKIFHTDKFPVLESEMLSFPQGINDDVVDATVTAINYFTQSKKSASSKTLDYV